jgi:hypothetical protein
MCKTRIKEWHLEKNYKAQEKQAVLDLLQRIEPSAMSNISFEIRGRPAKMDRIFRYSRDGRIVQADVDRLATSSLLLRTKRRKVQVSGIQNEEPVRDQLIHSLSPPNSFFSLSAPEDLQDIENIMYDTAQYYRSYFSPSDRFGKAELLRWQPFFGQTILGDLVDQYLHACQAARRSNYNFARIFLDRAHRQLYLAMLAQHSQLLGATLEIIHTPSYNANFETAELFARFAADMSRAIYGENHPITKFLRRFSRTTTRGGWLLNAFDQMRMATARDVLGDSHPETIVLKIASCYRLRKPDNSQREKVLDEALKTAEDNYGHRHNLTLRALIDRAVFNLRGMGDLDKAEADFENVMKRYQESSADIATKHAKLKALKGLMTVATIRRNWAEGESLSREALEISIKELGQDHYYTKGLAEGLVDSLWQQGRVDEARQRAKVHRLEVEAEL